MIAMEELSPDDIEQRRRQYGRIRVNERQTMLVWQAVYELKARMLDTYRQAKVEGLEGQPLDSIRTSLRALGRTQEEIIRVIEEKGWDLPNT